MAILGVALKVHFLKNKQVVVGMAFSLIFVLLVVGELSFSHEVATLRRDIAHLREEQALSELEINHTASEVEAYKNALSELSRYLMRVLEDEVSFYSNVESALARNGINVAEIHPAGAGGGVVAVWVNFAGNYSSALQTIADWRQMDGVARLRSLVLLSGEEGTTRGTAVLEAVLKR